MSILKYAYLLDQDNYIIENKIFIDLMWYISKNKDNGTDKPKGINTKSYVIRNAGIMFQQIFYWHYNAIKHQKPTKYQYNDKGTSINVVKMDFADWWDSIRLTDTEVTTANKFLLETNLINIHKMRIKVKDSNVFKPSNCYSLNIELLEQYMDSIIEISKDMYKEKVEDVRQKNIESTLKSKAKLSTQNSVTSETRVTLESEGLEVVQNDLFTLSTESTDKNNSVTLETGVTKVTSETQVTKATLETSVTKDTLETEVTNKSNTSFTDNHTDTSYTDSNSFTDHWNKTIELLKNKLSDVSFKTWIELGILETINKNTNITIYTANNFNAEILNTRYKQEIKEALLKASAIEYDINIEVANM